MANTKGIKVSTTSGKVLKQPKLPTKVETVVESVENTVIEPTAPASSREDKLYEALMESQRELRALRATNSYAGENQRVVLKNLGYVQLSFGVDGGRTVILNTRGPKSVGSVPLFVYEQYKRETNWFDLGWVKVMGEVPDNPNVIEDAALWISALKEEEIDGVVSQITSEAALMKLWNHLETTEKKSGKDLVLKAAVKRKINDIASYELTEDH